MNNIEKPIYQASRKKVTRIPTEMTVDQMFDLCLEYFSDPVVTYLLDKWEFPTGCLIRWGKRPGCLILTVVIGDQEFPAILDPNFPSKKTVVDLFDDAGNCVGRTCDIQTGTSQQLDGFLNTLELPLPKKVTK